MAASSKRALLCSLRRTNTISSRQTVHVSGDQVSNARGHAVLSLFSSGHTLLDRIPVNSCLHVLWFDNSIRVHRNGLKRLSCVCAQLLQISGGQRQVLFWGLSSVLRIMRSTDLIDIADDAFSILLGDHFLFHRLHWQQWWPHPCLFRPQTISDEHQLSPYKAISAHLVPSSKFGV